ncbi:MAG: hypothetical protein ACRCY9_11510 [Phycicoccus sp.]
MNEETDRLLGQLLEEPPGPRREQMLTRLDGAQREQIQALLDAGDLVWEAAHTAPPLEEDPVAAMLGVVPDPGLQLDAAALVSGCKARGVKPTVLAARLSARGWQVDTPDVFRWQTRASPEVPPALIKAIAEELGTDPDRLVSTAQPQPNALRAVAEDVAATPRFRDLAQRFARIQRMSPTMAVSALQSRMLATVHRGDEPNREQMLASVEELVRALEANQGQ